MYPSPVTSNCLSKTLQEELATTGFLPAEKGGARKLKQRFKRNFTEHVAGRNRRFDSVGGDIKLRGWQALVQEGTAETGGQQPWCRSHIRCGLPALYSYNIIHRALSRYLLYKEIQKYHEHRYKSLLWIMKMYLWWLRGCGCCLHHWKHAATDSTQCQCYGGCPQQCHRTHPARI